MPAVPHPLWANGYKDWMMKIPAQLKTIANQQTPPDAYQWDSRMWLGRQNMLSESSYLKESALTPNI